ncbi:MAG: hypothetical protein H6582_11765 [Crocinitomicaceae bacterium]|nr:hypothetical protein [Crocinitomicaceae bacterium]
MDYVLLTLIPKKTFSILETEKVKKLINKLLVMEFVDDKTIFWDENGDLIFHPPVNKRDRNYWLNALNSQIDGKYWELKSGRI